MLEQMQILLDAQYTELIRPSQGTSATSNLFIGNLPSQTTPPVPDLAVVLSEYPSGSPGETFGDAFKWEKTRLQVLVRNKNFAPARDLAYKIMKFLGSIEEQDLGGVRYHKIKALGTPSSIGPDTSDRQRLTVNFDIMKQIESPA